MIKVERTLNRRCTGAHSGAQCIVHFQSQQRSHRFIGQRASRVIKFSLRRKFRLPAGKEQHDGLVSFGSSMA
jgi:hypothetical protein